MHLPVMAQEGLYFQQELSMPSRKRCFPVLAGGSSMSISSGMHVVNTENIALAIICLAGVIVVLWSLFREADYLSFKQLEMLG
jgi:hypothetical protein